MYIFLLKIMVQVHVELVEYLKCDLVKRCDSEVD